eukprot:12108873-Karenia_brevis.AAC.1
MRAMGALARRAGLDRPGSGLCRNRPHHPQRQFRQQPGGAPRWHRHARSLRDVRMQLVAPHPLLRPSLAAAQLERLP